MFGGTTGFGSSNNKFDRPLSGWNVSNVVNMEGMFVFSDFNQPIGNWNVSGVTNFNSFMENKTPLTFSASNLDDIYTGWTSNGKTVKPNITISFGTAKYTCDAEFGKAALNSNPNYWTITDGGTVSACTPFISVWKTTSPSETVTLPYQSLGLYSGTINWGDGSVSANTYTNRTHSYASANSYTVTMSGATSGFTFYNGAINGDYNKITEIKQFGQLFRFGNSGGYLRSTSLTMSAVTDTPDLRFTTNLSRMFEASTPGTILNINNWDMSKITNMSNMFASSNFNQSISGWNVSNVNIMNSMFQSNTAFNRQIGNWDVSNVNSMTAMFRENRTFNQPLSGWNVSNVTIMNNMFLSSIFNQPIGNWDVSKVQYMNGMFASISSGPYCNFNQPLSGWNVTSLISTFAMFQYNLVFNQPIFSAGTTTSLDNISFMFEGNSVFNQPLNHWVVTAVTIASAFLISSSSYSTVNYDNLLISWSQQSVKPNVTLNMGNVKYSPSAQSAKNILTGSTGSGGYGWGITDGGPI
jgi:surface protein